MARAAVRRKPRKARHRIRWSASNLPVWVIEPTRFKGSVKLTCPRCQNWAVVNELKWLRSSEFMTRPCSFCFKTNQIPEQLTERFM